MTDIVSFLKRPVSELQSDCASSSEKSLSGFSGVLNSVSVFSPTGKSIPSSIDSSSSEQAKECSKSALTMMNLKVPQNVLTDFCFAMAGKLAAIKAIF